MLERRLPGSIRKLPTRIISRFLLSFFTVICGRILPVPSAPRTKPPAGLVVFGVHDDAPVVSVDHFGVVTTILSMTLGTPCPCCIPNPTFPLSNSFLLCGLICNPVSLFITSPYSCFRQNTATTSSRRWATLNPSVSFTHRDSSFSPIVSFW